jgi:RNA polymerase sigma-70 factor (ECF subfamily)
MPPLTDDAEALLWARLRAPSASEREKAFAEVYQALRTSVFALCLHITGRKPEAEDALQDCFVAVHRGLAGFRGEARLATWAYRIAVRSALAVRARRGPARALEETTSYEASDGSPGPEALASSRQELARLRAAFDQLSSEHQLVLSLFAVDGLGHVEIAEVLGVPTGTVWSRLHLARKRLNALLA